MGFIHGSTEITCSFLGVNGLTYDVFVNFQTQSLLAAETVKRVVTSYVSSLFTLEFLRAHGTPEAVVISSETLWRPPPPQPTPIGGDGAGLSDWGRPRDPELLPPPPPRSPATVIHAEPPPTTECG